MSVKNIEKRLRIMRRKQTALETVVAIAIVLILGFVIVYGTAYYEEQSLAKINKWANEYHYTLITRPERCWLDRGPYWTLDEGQVIYVATVADTQERRRTVYFRIRQGGFWDGFEAEFND